MASPAHTTSLPTHTYGTFVGGKAERRVWFRNHPCVTGKLAAVDLSRAAPSFPRIIARSRIKTDGLPYPDRDRRERPCLAVRGSTKDRCADRGQEARERSCRSGDRLRPVGLPHIGTFGEVFRTTMVRRAFEHLMPDVPTKLIAFSDDMDGFRKVLTNLPKQELLAKYLNKPLTQVPDIFGTHESFGAHNDNLLMEFLDSLALNTNSCLPLRVTKAACLTRRCWRPSCTTMRLWPLCCLRSAKSGRPPMRHSSICPTTGNVLQVAIIERDTDAGTVVYEVDPNGGGKVEIPVTGHCKLQWKCDWAMRWHALGVDYEMSGKDLSDSVKQSSKICRTLGSKPPESLSYELFLDEEGGKISKSKGNGLSVEDWLRYGSPESLSLFMYQQPKRAKRLYFDVIPKNTDEYFQFLDKLENETDIAVQVENPAWHITQGAGRGNGEDAPHLRAAAEPCKRLPCRGHVCTLGIYRALRTGSGAGKPVGPVLGPDGQLRRELLHRLCPTPEKVPRPDRAGTCRIRGSGW